MIDSDILVKWTTALRSGKFPQIIGQFETDEGYCALGVLIQTCPELRWRDFGITQELVSKVAQLNDSGKSFESIARWLENNKEV